jgi:hypothetical protein
MSIIEKIVVDVNDGVKVSCPYSPELVAWAKKHGGRWLNNMWAFDARDEEAVREALMSLYGTDGRAVPLVDIKIEISAYAPQRDNKAAFWMFGRCLAERKHRDAAVRLGDGVILSAGGFHDYGGSAKNPELCPKSGTVLEVRDVPEALIDKDDPDIQIIRRSAVDKDALRAEAEQLRKRLEEIEQLLSE